jgi:hypothetical protein
VRQWLSDFYGTPVAPGQVFIEIATQAARWAANIELGSCVYWLSDKIDEPIISDLCDFRRPKPLSLKEQALEALETIPELVGFESERDAIRAALEALDD